MIIRVLSYRCQVYAARSSRNDIGANLTKTAIITAQLRDQQLADFFQIQREMLPAKVRTVRCFDNDAALNWLFA